MKKLAVVLMLAVVFTITLTGCSKDKGNQETTAGQLICRQTVKLP